MAEIPNAPSHSLIPGDFFVIVNDPDETVFIVQPVPGSSVNETISFKRTLIGVDMQVLRVDGDLIDVIFLWRHGMLPRKTLHHKSINVSKIDYKRISRLPFEE